MKISYTKIILFSFAIIISFIAIWSYVDWLNVSDYWGLAPDGKYSVFIYDNIEKGRIYFSICENSGGDLHGYWNVASNVSIPDSILNKEHQCGYATATLQNNVIVNLEAKEP
jgi:hypothetical protein